MIHQLNTRIIAVDDDDSILTIYKDVLQTESSRVDSIIKRRRKKASQSREQEIEYELLLANSGEEAIEIANKQMDLGNQIAVGFVDMKMPKGIDGLETIKQLKQINPNILIAIVTAYTDRTIEQISTAFDNQDEWIYFNKPFTHGELKQAALNLVLSWNRRKNTRQSMRAIKQITNIIRESRNHVDELARILPTDKHLQILEHWSSRDI